MNKKIKKGEYLDILLRSKKTIFSTKDVALLWGEKNETAARVRLSYYVRFSKLLRVHRGLYAKDKNYDKFELATKIYTPSYISFETVLARAGIVFQLYRRIFVATYLKRDIIEDDQTYSYKRIKDLILTNSAGVKVKDNYCIACPERAFLDVVYSNKDYHFDNLSPLNWKRVFEILSIYSNKRMEKKVKKYHKSVSDQGTSASGGKDAD